MQGRHGAQLALAYHEIKTKPSPPIGIHLDDDLRQMISSVHNDDDDDDDDEVEQEEEMDERLEVETEEEGVGGDEVMYDNRGFPILSRSMERAYKAGAPAGGSFAIIKMGGTQYKVSADDVIISDKLKPVSKYHVGAELTLDPEDVLLLGSKEKTVVGLPFINGAKVSIRVEELTRDAKVIIFKKRRRKNSRRKNGFKREVSMVRVVGIEFPQVLINSSNISDANMVAV